MVEKVVKRGKEGMNFLIFFSLVYLLFLILVDAEKGDFFP